MNTFKTNEKIDPVKIYKTSAKKKKKKGGIKKK